MLTLSYVFLNIPDRRTPAWATGRTGASTCGADGDSSQSARAMPRSPMASAAMRSNAIGVKRFDPEWRLEGMLRRHEEEWSGFVDSLGPRSFVAQWIARGH